jgi:hypothetical protein
VYEDFFEALEGVERAAGDIPLKFVLIPDEFQVEDELWEEIVRQSGKPLDRDLPQRRIVEWLQARGRSVLDLLPLLRAVEPLEDGRRHVYHAQNMHFNARGNAIAGRALAGFLGPFPVERLPLRLRFGNGTIRRWMHEGWNKDESDGRMKWAWSDGLRSVLMVPLTARGDVQLDFEAFPLEFPGSPQQRITIVLNGTVIGEQPLHPGRHRYSVTLPGGALRDSTNTLEFRYAYARVPQDVLAGSPDTRLLGVAWLAMDFTERAP